MFTSRTLFFFVCLCFAVRVSAQTLTCSSDDMGRHFCRANTSNGVQMVHQRSGSPCTQNYSWGYDSGGIWVDHGCRADFSLGGNGGGSYGSSPDDAMRLCKNTASGRLPGVPLAYISVYRASDAGNSYIINFKSQPPNGRSSSGFCRVAKTGGQLQDFQFDAGSGGGNYGGGGSYGTSPDDAMRTCKNTASGRLPGVPLAYISVYRASDAGNSYIINFKSQPPNGGSSSGFCRISKTGGQVQDFQFDANSGGSNGVGSGATTNAVTPMQAMRSCKSEVSSQRPNIPLAYITVDQATPSGGGSFQVNFHARPPNGYGASGYCTVWMHGQVTMHFDR